MFAAGVRFAAHGVDIQRMPLDEAIPVAYIYMLRNLNKDEREEAVRELDAPIVAPADDTRSTDEREDDDLFAVLGLSGLRTRPTPAAPAPPVLDS